MFLEYLGNWVKEKEGWMNEQQLKVEHVINHGTKKIEMGISNTVTNNSGSFELLDNGTCDMMIIDYKTDKSIFFDTVYLKDINDLKDILSLFVIKLRNA